MISNGVAGAVTVFVSHAFGRKNVKDIYRHTRAGLHLATICMGICGLCLVIFGREISLFFIPNSMVAELSIKMFLISAVMEFFDGWQITYLGALRGLLDVQRPMIYSVSIYLFGGVSIGYILGFTVHWGAVGIFCGLAVSLVLAALLLHYRFLYSIKRHKRRWEKEDLQSV
jgi:MATE family multidrug resistance protein